MKAALLAVLFAGGAARAACPDGVCEGGETHCSCPADCPPACGDGCCAPFFETECSCTDCIGMAVCGDLCCTASETASCSADCGTCNSDGTCDAGETPCCSLDACTHSLCNDACCDATESACDCPSDCPPSCGDGCCTDPEGCTTCPSDCGSCTEPLPEPTPEPTLEPVPEPAPDAMRDSPPPAVDSEVGAADSSGCSCRAMAAPSAPWLTLGAAALAVLLRGRSRRGRRRSDGVS